MPDSAPGVADHKVDTATQINDLETRLTNLEAAVGRIAGLEAHTTANAAGEHADEAPQLEQAPGTGASS